MFGLCPHPTHTHTHAHAHAHTHYVANGDRRNQCMVVCLSLARNVSGTFAVLGKHVHQEFEGVVGGDIAKPHHLVNHLWNAECGMWNVSV